MGTGEAGVFTSLLSQYKELDFSNVFTGVFSVLQVGWGYLKLVWSLFWWDYSFFYGTYEIIRYFCWTISIGIIVALILSVTRGTSSA